MNIFPRLFGSMCRLVVVLTLLVAPLTVAAGEQFLSAVDDLPLMDGLSEAEGGTMAFDSPNGRVVETLATGSVTKDKVLKFYSATLPQLGWKEEFAGRFTRDEEVLRLEFPTQKGLQNPPLTVRFMLMPAK